jgi:outer membrane protein
MELLMNFRLRGLWALPLGAAALGAPASADTLQDALSEAYLNNPTLLAARASQRATDEGVPIAKASGRPNAQATADYIEFVKVSPNSFSAPERTLQIGPTLNVPIYAGGAVKNAVKAAEERVAAGQADLRGTESAIFAQVVAAYMDVLRNAAIVSLSANQVDVLMVNLEATSDRFEIGDLTRTDVAQSRARLATAQSNLRGSEANLIAARETYLQLVGTAPHNLEAPPPLPGLPEDVEQAVLYALEYNPDLIAARERAEAAGFDTRVAGAGRKPTVGLFANGAYTDYFGTLGGLVSNNFAQSETTANAGVRVSIPIFQGGLPAARKRQAAALESASLEQVIAAERSVIQQTRASWSSWQASLAIIDSEEAAVSAAELSLEGVRAENSIGNRSILDVLNAEQELLGARVQLVTARRNAYVAGFSLLASMGRAEARDLGLMGEGLLYDPVVNYERVEGKWNDFDNDPAPVTQSTSTASVPAADASIEPLADSSLSQSASAPDPAP